MDMEILVAATYFQIPVYTPAALRPRQNGDIGAVFNLLLLQHNCTTQLLLTDSYPERDLAPAHF